MTLTKWLDLVSDWLSSWHRRLGWLYGWILIGILTTLTIWLLYYFFVGTNWSFGKSAGETASQVTQVTPAPTVPQATQVASTNPSSDYTWLWFLFGALASIVGGQIAHHYTKLKFLGQGVTGLGVVASALTLMITFWPTNMFWPKNETTKMLEGAFGAILKSLLDVFVAHPVATFLTICVFVSGGYWYFQIASGKWSSRFYAAVFVGGIASLVLSLVLGDKFWPVLKGFQGQIQTVAVDMSQGKWTVAEANASASVGQTTPVKELPVEWMRAVDGEVTLTEDHWTAMDIPSQEVCVSHHPSDGTDAKREGNRYMVRSLSGQRVAEFRILRAGETFVDYTCS